MALSTEETNRLQAYLQARFRNFTLTLQARGQAEDSADVLLVGEFFGTVYKDDDEDGVSYVFNITTLDIDLLDDQEAAKIIQTPDSNPPDVPATPPETAEPAILPEKTDEEIE